MLQLLKIYLMMGLITEVILTAMICLAKLILSHCRHLDRQDEVIMCFINKLNDSCRDNPKQFIKYALLRIILWPRNFTGSAKSLFGIN